MHRNLTSIADLVCVGDAQWLVTAATELEAEAAGTALVPEEIVVLMFRR